jgi:hypothetical protein
MPEIFRGAFLKKALHADVGLSLCLNDKEYR